MSDPQPLIVDLTDQPIAACTPAQAKPARDWPNGSHPHIPTANPASGATLPTTTAYSSDRLPEKII